MSIALLCNFSNKAISQNVYQGFETQTEVNNLIANCWTFTNFSYSSTAPLTGTGNIVSQLGVVSELITPELLIPSTLTISFSYNTISTSNGSKTIKVFLLINGVETQLESINLNSNPDGIVSNSYTNANTPGQNINGSRKIIFRVTNNASVQFDELNINAAYTYPGGCSSIQSPLPVKLLSFQGNMNKNTVSLQWSVAENEINDHFEVEKSLDGKVFLTTGSVIASAKNGNENYSFNETITNDKVYYRLKMFDKNQVMTYSKILAFQNKFASTNGLKIINNPVADKLTLSISSTNNYTAEIKVYDLSGRMKMQQRVNVYEGDNQVSLPLTSGFHSGIYFVEVNNGIEKQSVKFIKQ
jgi:hypothetical protein